MGKYSSTHPVYFTINEFVKDEFREGFLMDIKDPVTEEGKICFYVDVSLDNTLHHLKFNEHGALLSRESEPAFLADPHDDFLSEEDYYTGNG